MCAARRDSLARGRLRDRRHGLRVAERLVVHAGEVIAGHLLARPLQDGEVEHELLLVLLGGVDRLRRGL